MSDNFLGFSDPLFSDPLEGPSNAFYSTPPTVSFSSTRSSPPLDLDNQSVIRSTIYPVTSKLESLRLSQPYLSFLTNKEHVYVVIYPKNQEDCVDGLELESAQCHFLRWWRQTPTGDPSSKPKTQWGKPKKSSVWPLYQEVALWINGQQRVRCLTCGKVLQHPADNGTNTMKTHLSSKACGHRPPKSQDQDTSQTKLTAWKNGEVSNKIYTIV